MTRLSRRHFLKTSTAVVAGFSGLRQLVQGEALAEADGDHSANGYGPLEADPRGILDLPKGFRYRIISRRGREMDDGFLVPDKPDGMAAFPGPRGLTLLIRNHELTPDQTGPFGDENKLLKRIDRAKLYDYGRGETPGCGGTTTLLIDTKRQKVVREFLSLAGTHRNCAGGPTPWNSWITCEETTVRVGKNTEKEYFAEQDHGYNFEVPARAGRALADPVPLKAMGRFRHEAVAVDPKSGIVYQTEDVEDGLLYRYVPHQPGKLAAGGKLQALTIADQPSADTRNWDQEAELIQVGCSLPVAWIDLDDVQSPKNDLRHRGFDAGAARFARGEGMWFGKDGIYFACTNGGRTKTGQIWRYVPSESSNRQSRRLNAGRLELFVEPNDSSLVRNADNLTVAPWGDLIVCEDRSGDDVRLVGVTPKGKLYTFARNHRKTEFAGATFSPDGSTLFVNLQHEGLTVAITGPWRPSRPV